MKKQSVKETVKQLDVVLTKNGAFYVALCRSLNVSTFGKTQKAAMSAFKEVLEIFTSIK